MPNLIYILFYYCQDIDSLVMQRRYHGLHSLRIANGHCSNRFATMYHICPEVRARCFILILWGRLDDDVSDLIMIVL